jgi:Leucine-rich repeat (LRR) protein
MQADYIEIARGITECLERNKDKIFFRDANCEEIATQFAAYEDHWEKLSGIKAISLEGLSLTALPEAIKHLPALKTLEIWKCGIQELPPWIGDIPGLHLCFYDLTNEWAVSLFGNFDEPWFKTAKIAGLSFQGKNLTEISERVRNLPLLQTVSLQGSSLTKLPDWIWDIATLKKLKLYDCSKIKELPQGITRCSSLETIEIRSCSIEKIPDDIGSLKSLKNLTIDNYETSYIPPSFANLHSLETLKLAFHANNMSELPDFIGDLTSLIRLRLRIVDGEGKFRTLPATIGNLKALKGLAIFYWQYHGEDEDEVTFSLPETIGELESLVDLYLCGANIKKLPESIGKLTQLRLLDLNGSGLLSLPASI